MSMASFLAELKPFPGTAEELNTFAVGFCSLLCFLALLPILINCAKRHEAITKLLFRRRLSSLPPGPPRLPVVGNLHQVGSMPHRSLQRLAARYGPLMYLKLGQVPTVVVSSPAVAAEVLKTQDHLFCTRPPLSAVRSIFYGGKDVAFTPYNGYWRQMRRVCTQELFTSRRVELFRRPREEEVATLVNTIRLAASRAGASPPPPVNLSDMLLCLLNNIICREVFGRRFPAAEGDCGRSRFHELVTDWTTLMGHFNVGEYFPSMEWINVLTGLRKRFRRCFRDMDAFLDAVTDNHLRQCSEPHKDEDELRHEYLISILLRCVEDSSLDIPLTLEHVKAVLMDMFIAGTDTGTLALEWGMAELVKHPRAMRKAQAEVRRVAGEAELVEERHVQELHYLKMVVKEVLRLHPPGPFLLPRASMAETRVAGFDVPANTRVTINVWAIGRHPDAWEDPDAFLPERFEGSAVDFRGQHFQLLPFGAGRRGCPGVGLGTAVVEFALANLLHCFDWEVPDGGRGEDLDMEEEFGIVIRKRKPLLLRATPWMPSS